MASKLELNNINESYVQVTCSEDLAKELKEYFTFSVPGAQFSPKYKAKLWNGKISLFDRHYKIYRGLAQHIIDWAAEQKYQLKHDLTDDSFSVAEAMTFIASLNLKIQPRDYQIKAFIRAIRKRRRLFLSPTSSGKSLIIYLILRYLHEKTTKRTLVIVPTTSLVGQLANDFIDYGFDSDRYVHRICEGETKVTDKPIIISTWQAIYKMPKKWFEQFDCVVGDEAHLFKAKSLSYIVSSCVNARHRFGLTGTLDDTEVHKLVLEGLFGPLHRVATTDELIQAGHVAKFRIKALLLKYGALEANKVRRLSYSEEMEFLCGHEGRNRFIRNLALSLENNTLVLFQYVEKHGHVLYEMIMKGNTDPTRKIFYVYGKTDSDTREEIRKIVEKETNAIIIASYGTFSTGVNIKNLHNVIFASPSKSKIKVLQSIGRTLRLSTGKEQATLFDIADDLRTKTNENYTFKHFLTRLKIYNDEKFKFKIYKIELGK